MSERIREPDERNNHLPRRRCRLVGRSLVLILYSLGVQGLTHAQTNPTTSGTPSIDELEKQLDQAKAQAKSKAAGRSMQVKVGALANANLVTLPGGNFEMGSPNVGESPVHEVRIAPFSIMKYPVTRGEFAAFVNQTQYKAANCYGVLSITFERLEGGAVNGRFAEEHLTWRNPGFAQDDRHPVVCVSWSDAQRYAEWLSRKTGHRWRLPSSAEYEYATRAGTKSARPWGENPDEACEYANVADATARMVVDASKREFFEFHNCSDNATYTSPVGSYRPNNWGLYDMLGNVSEFVQDCPHDNYNGAPTDGSAWETGPFCETHRLARGGSWISGPNRVRSAFANDMVVPSMATNDSGFRLVRVN